MLLKPSQVAASQKLISQRKSVSPMLHPLGKDPIEKATILWKEVGQSLNFSECENLYHFMPSASHIIRNQQLQKTNLKQSRWGWNLKIYMQALPFCSRSWGIYLNHYPSIISIKVANVDPRLRVGKRNYLPWSHTWAWCCHSNQQGQLSSECHQPWLIKSLWWIHRA